LGRVPGSRRGDLHEIAVHVVPLDAIEQHAVNAAKLERVLFLEAWVVRAL
jgi:hypothetical protein